MRSGLTTDTLRGAIHDLACAMERSADDLNALDSRIGDGDIGVTMVTGPWHYILNITDQHPDREELYNWTTDPAEMVNIFDHADPALIRFIYDEFARYRVTTGLFDIAGIDLTARTGG